MKLRNILVDNWCKAWRWWSLRFNALGLLILGWIQFDPASALFVWNQMPGAVRSVVPPSAMIWIGMALFVLSMLSRFVKQPKANA